MLANSNIGQRVNTIAPKLEIERNDERVVKYYMNHPRSTQGLKRLITKNNYFIH